MSRIKEYPTPDPRRPIVYLPTNVGHDVSDAERFGQPTVVLERHEMLPSPEAELALRRAAARLRPEDFLLLIGDPLAMSWLSALAFKRLPQLKVLRWSRLLGRYECYAFDSQNLMVEA